MYCAKCGLIRRNDQHLLYQASCPQIIIPGGGENYAQPLQSPRNLHNHHHHHHGLLFANVNPQMATVYPPPENVENMNEQLLQLEDGYIKEIIVQILPALTKTNMQKQPKLLVHGIVVTHAIDRYGLVSDFNYNENSFKHEFLLPSEIDTDRVTWVLQSQTNMNHPIRDKYTEHNQLVTKAPFVRRSSSTDYLFPGKNIELNSHLPLNNNDRLVDYAAHNYSCDCQGNEFETSQINQDKNQINTRLLCMNDNEEGKIQINRSKNMKNNTAQFFHHKVDEMSTNETVQTINLEGSDGEGSVQMNFPLKMSDQSAVYYLTEEGCELVEELDYDIDENSLKILMKKQQGKIWLTFAKEIVQKANSDKNKPFVDTYKLKTTSRREYKLNPNKFDLSQIKARTTDGKLIIKVPFRKE